MLATCSCKPKVCFAEGEYLKAFFKNIKKKLVLTKKPKAMFKRKLIAKSKFAKRKNKPKAIKP